MTKAQSRVGEPPSGKVEQAKNAADTETQGQPAKKWTSRRSQLAAALVVVVLALTSSVVSLLVAPPLINLVVGVIITVAGAGVGLIRRKRRHVAVKPWLGAALFVVGLALTSFGWIAMNQAAGAQQTEAMRETCASQLDYEDASVAAVTAQLASNFDAPTVSETQTRVLDALTELTQSANRSRYQEAKDLALRIRNGVVEEASTGSFDVKNLRSRADRVAADVAFRALCECSSIHLSNPGEDFEQSSEQEFCTSLRALLDMMDGPGDPNDKSGIAIQQAYKHFYQVTGLQSSEDLKGIGVAIFAGLMAVANGEKDNDIDLRYLAAALDTAARGPCAAQQISLGHIGRPPLVIANPDDSPTVVATKLLQHLRPDCKPLPVDVAAPFLDLRCSRKPWSVKVFGTKAKRDAWLSTQAASSLRYVYGDPAWVLQVTDIFEVISVRAELDGQYLQPK